MRRVTIPLCAALGLLLLPSAGQARTVDFGVQAERQGSETLSREEVMRMRRGGVKLLRTPLEWEIVQSSGPDQPYDTSNFDQLVEWSQEGDLPKLEILPILIGTPAWVEGAETNNEPPTTALDLERWQAFVTAMVDRYGANGPIDAWQVWNEPNLSAFWTDRDPDVREYAAFLQLTDRAIRDGETRAKTVLAGMPQRPGAPKPQTEFLRPLYRIKGVRKAFDIVATHPYATSKDQAVDSVKAIRGLMNRFNDRRTPIWITESGFASAGPRHPFRRPGHKQGTELRRVFTAFQRNASKLDIEKVVWFSWRDSDTDPPTLPQNNVWQTYTGLFSFDGDPKAAWKQFTRLAGGEAGSGRIGAEIEPTPPAEEGGLDPQGKVRTP